MPPNDVVFLIQDGQVQSLPQRSYRDGILGKTLEEALQVLIERYPELLPGSQIDPDDPPRFALLAREMPIGPWSLDHLLVDQAGILTLVETKLSENPESRREVIGQMLEYATNAAASWRDGRLQERAAAYWAKRDRDLNDVLRQRFGNPDLDTEEYWRGVHDNLRHGRIRLLIVADSLRPEARRIIEYLNGEMENAEVYGLELQCHGRDAAEPFVLTPRLVGQTQTITDSKRAGTALRWTADGLRAAYRNLADASLARHLQTILDWAVDRQYFMQTVAKTPTFGLQGREGARIFTFLADGAVYWYANLKHCGGGVAERDQLFADLQTLGLVDSTFDLDGIVSGRNLRRKLGELRDAEVQKLVEILSHHLTGQP